VKYWETIADNLKKAGWSWGCILAVDSNGRTIWIADAHRGDGKRFVARADEKLTAFVEQESARPRETERHPSGEASSNKVLASVNSAPVGSGDRVKRRSQRRSSPTSFFRPG
jgi:hypothetical protein